MFILCRNSRFGDTSLSRKWGQNIQLKRGDQVKICILNGTALSACSPALLPECQQPRVYPPEKRTKTLHSPKDLQTTINTQWASQVTAPAMHTELPTGILASHPRSWKTSQVSPHMKRNILL